MFKQSLLIIYRKITMFFDTLFPREGKIIDFSLHFIEKIVSLPRYSCRLFIRNVLKLIKLTTY